ncbi:MAG: SBBP repeat-containing protein [Patescibacteria group bacterium]
MKYIKHLLVVLFVSVFIIASSPVVTQAQTERSGMQKIFSHLENFFNRLNGSATSGAAQVAPSTDIEPPTYPQLPSISGVTSTGLTLTWWQSRDNVGVAGYKIYKAVYPTPVFELIATVTGTTSYRVTNLTPYTIYFFKISAFDAAGNESEKASAARRTLADTTATTTPSTTATTTPVVTPIATTTPVVKVPVIAEPKDTVDTIAPTFPITGPFKIGITASSISLQWFSAVDNVGVTGYYVYRITDGVSSKIATIQTPQYIDSNLAGGKLYEYKISAFDAAGNESLKISTNPMSVTSKGDTTPPVVTLLSPANGSTVSGVVFVGADATDSVGVQSVRFTTGTGASLGSDDDITPYSLQWDTRAVANGSHTLVATARDAAGNSAQSSVTVNVSNVAAVPGSTLSVKQLGGLTSDYGFAVARDASGNAYVGGSVDSRAYIAKLSPDNQQVIWTKAFESAGSVQAMAVDSIGDVYVAGHFYATSTFGATPVVSRGGYDAFVVKYRSNGAYVWHRAFGSESAADFAGDETVTAMTLDTAGNPVIVGSLLDITTIGAPQLPNRGGKEAYVAKLQASTGLTSWAKAFGNSGTDDSATGVAIDSNNNVYVAGRFSVNIDLAPEDSLKGLLTSAGSYDVFYGKFTSTGSHIWSHRAGATGYDTPGGIAADRSNDLVMVGNYRLSGNMGGQQLTPVGEEDVFVAKYASTTGGHIWSKSFGSFNTDIGNGVSVDELSNIYVAIRAGAAVDFGGGTISVLRSGFNAGMAKFTPAGGHVWSRIIGHGSEEVFDTLAANDGVYWVGRFGSRPTATAPDAVYTDFGNNFKLTTYSTSSTPDIFLLKTNR